MLFLGEAAARVDVVDLGDEGPADRWI